MDQQANPQDLDAAYSAKLLLVNMLADTLYTTALRKREFHGGTPIPTWDYDVVAGPRAARLKLRAGLSNDRLYQKLTEKRMAKLRALFSSSRWGLSSDPSVEWVGDDLVIEALFPAGLQVTHTYLDRPGDSVSIRANDGASAILGLTEDWRYTTIIYSGMDAHALYVGRSGGGKTTTIETILTQLARSSAQFALVDGKGGGPESLDNLATMHGLVGPIAHSHAEAQAVMNFVDQEMQRRNDAVACEIPFHLVIDEFHVYTQAAEFSYALADYGRRARSKNMHLHLGTQRSDASVWGAAGGMLQGQCGNIVFHKMATHNDVMTVTGCSYPPAHTLGGAGDVYFKSERRGVVRCQVALASDADFATVTGDEPGTAWEERTTENRRFSTAQQCAAVYVASLRAADPRTGGRGTLQSLLERIEAPERKSDTADALLDLGRALYDDFTTKTEKRKER